VSFARFFAPAAGVPGERILLPVDEAEHLTRVLRLSTGAHVRIFNGRGAEFDAVVARADKTAVLIDLVAPHTPAPEPHVAMTLAQAVLKGDKMDDVVRDAVMLGVATIQPLLTTRTEIALATLIKGRRRQRWERIAVSSAKQCGRAVVPGIGDAHQFASLAALALPKPVFILVEPQAGSGVPLTSIDAAMPKEATLVVGPEGGWTGDEVRLAAEYGTLLTLGGLTLRADAMPLVALSALFAWWRAF
jgi:16S rRNA (uracil1498-N3)-methyltransferase